MIKELQKEFIKEIHSIMNKKENNKKVLETSIAISKFISKLEEVCFDKEKAIEMCNLTINLIIENDNKLRRFFEDYFELKEELEDKFENEKIIISFLIKKRKLKEEDFINELDYLIEKYQLIKELIDIEDLIYEIRTNTRYDEDDFDMEGIKDFLLEDFKDEEDIINSIGYYFLIGEKVKLEKANLLVSLLLD